jgi:hypothetical protein
LALVSLHNPPTTAAAHVGEYATVEGVVAKVFTSDNGNTFLNIGARYPKPNVHRRDSAGISSE